METTEDRASGRWRTICAPMIFVREASEAAGNQTELRQAEGHRPRCVTVRLCDCVAVWGVAPKQLKNRSLSFHTVAQPVKKIRANAVPRAGSEGFTPHKFMVAFCAVIRCRFPGELRDNGARTTLRFRLR